MPNLTQSRLKELLHYNPETGVFTRRKTISNAKKGSVAGNPKANGYLQIEIDNAAYQAHRLARLYMKGELPEQDMDHINHIRHDNRWKNIRDATRQENARNQSLRAGSKSGCTGVSWDRVRLRWSARIMVDGRTLYLGRFLDLEAAIEARKAANVKYGFHENHGKAYQEVIDD